MCGCMYTPKVKGHRKDKRKGVILFLREGKLIKVVKVNERPRARNVMLKFIVDF